MPKGSRVIAAKKPAKQTAIPAKAASSKHTRAVKSVKKAPPAKNAGKAAPTKPPAKRSPPKKAPPKKAPPKKAPAKKAPPKKAPAKKAPAKKATAKKAPAKKAPAKKAPAKKAPGPVKAKAVPGQDSKAKVRAPGKAGSRAGRDDGLAKFLQDQRRALEAERASYEAQATALKAEADQMALDAEPGDIQFDDESGEGGTVNVDRERDLALSAQARAEVEEIDHALAKIDSGTYGVCESCGQPIPRARLKALPQARLCVSCKSGGLSRR